MTSRRRYALSFLLLAILALWVGQTGAEDASIPNPRFHKTPPKRCIKAGIRLANFKPGRLLANKLIHIAHAAAGRPGLGKLVRKLKNSPEVRKKEPSRNIATAVVCSPGRVPAGVTLYTRCMSGFSAHPTIVGYVRVPVDKVGLTANDIYITNTVSYTTSSWFEIPTELGQNGVQCWLQRTRFNAMGQPSPKHMFVPTDDGLTVPVNGDIIAVFRAEMIPGMDPRRTELYGVGHKLDKYRARLLTFGGPTSHYFAGSKLGEVGCAFKCMEKDNPPSHTLSRSDYGALEIVSDRTRPWKGLAHKLPLIVAHRGQLDYRSQENSLAQVERTVNHPAVDGFEVDVFLAKLGDDYEPIVSHDNNLMRLLGINFKLLFALKKHHRQDFLTLKKMTHCNFFSPLSKYLDILNRHENKVIDIELKPGNPFHSPFTGYAELIGRRVAQVLNLPKYQRLLATDRVLVSSFDSKKTGALQQSFTHFIKANAQRHMPRVRTARAIYKTINARILDAVWRRDSHYKTIMLHYSMVNRDLVREYHSKGYSVGAYTLYDATENDMKGSTGTKVRPSSTTNTIRNMLHSEVDFVETDDPIALQKAFLAAAKTITKFKLHPDERGTRSLASIRGKPLRQIRSKNKFGKWIADVVTGSNNKKKQGERQRVRVPAFITGVRG
eukprot:TRINITY_DN6596_c0_g1_i2.p1 TRINITY_DN6596_c0_g1~~TRINITY_DN6596_c0_g1_i2.p1  ORF type:complete len:664 (-),score=119.68 TRINITY_DN6596_c0_g1_i2:1243-3234(-)